MLGFNITKSDSGVEATVFLNNQLYTVTQESHKFFEQILEALGQEVIDEPQLEQLLNIRNTFNNVLAQNPELSIRDGQIFYGEEKLFGTLVDKILDFIAAKLPYQYLWNFLTKLMQNPNPHSREQLYVFLEKYHFPITPSGNFVAYKSVNQDLTSVHRGFGIVNGVQNEGHLDNTVGNVIEVPRDRVDPDPYSACSFGLHVGSIEYVEKFGPRNRRIVVCEVNPADVVSVPHDAHFQKVRTCRYEVISEFDGLITDQVVETKKPEVQKPTLRELVLKHLNEYADNYKSHKSKLHDPVNYLLKNITGYSDEEIEAEYEDLVDYATLYVYQVKGLLSVN